MDLSFAVLKCLQICISIFSIFFQGSSSSNHSTLDRWPNDLAGGILMQEPYITSAYEDLDAPSPAQDRFLNLTYLSSGSNRKLNRGSSLGSVFKDEFDTQKVAAHGTLKRMRFQKAATDSQLQCSPLQKEEDDSECGKIAVTYCISTIFGIKGDFANTQVKKLKLYFSAIIENLILNGITTQYSIM